MSDLYAESMSRTETESQRLDQQLENLNRNIGYLLHPSITDKLPRAPVIADVGTGTGRFLLQLAELYPEATFKGFDISQELFPVPESLPSNVKLGIMDVKEPPAPEEHGQYDVVHVRLLVAGMNSTDWDVAVRNLTQLLRPGGALQWEECNFLATQYFRGKVDSSVSTARFMASLFREALKEKFSYGWNTLPGIMRNSGLLEVEEDIVSSDRIVETREAVSINGLTAIFDWARRMSTRGMPGSYPMDELKKLEDQAYEDIKSGCYVRYDVHVSLGFKPE